MIKFRGLRPNASLLGIMPECLVPVVGAQWFAELLASAEVAA